MGDPLRDRQAVTKLAAAQQVIEIAAKVSDLGALSQAVAADLAVVPADEVPGDWGERPVTGTMRFDFVDGDRRVASVDGSVETRIDAVCQRCLAPFEMPLVAKLKYVFGVPDDSADAVPDREVWELIDTNVVPIDVVDEALVMALPFAAKHEDPDDCVEFDNTPETGERTTKPFATLKAQMDEAKQD